MSAQQTTVLGRIGPRNLLLGLTLLTYLILGLLFELQRAPYTPPGKETLLGTEAQLIPPLMGMIALAWLATAIYLAREIRFSLKDLLLTVFFAAVLLAVGVKVVTDPPWPVATETVIRLSN